MNRYNMFYQVHKALRAMLYTTAITLQQTDFFNEEEANASIKMVQETVGLFDEHAHTEDHFVLSAIEIYEPSAAALFEEEHVQDHVLSNQLRSLLNIFRHTETEAAIIQAGGAVRLAFTEFMVFNLQHMAKEESKLNHLLWKHFTDEQLKGITQTIITGLPPEKMIRFSAWMMKGLSNHEIINWLKEIKNNAPEFVFNSMLSLAEKELPAARWNQVQGNITEGAMLA
ncbi:MAG: hypothetical protein IPP72_21820 [Chitinophagaceae bacterium]|nr:hypothetical protein [Chitinophagaceae bacterium]